LQRQLTEKIQRINSLEDNELMLREQMRTFREDFESERRDREQAQSRIASLESEMEVLKQQVHICRGDHVTSETMKSVFMKRKIKIK